jgi:hypothetical protein
MPVNHEIKSQLAKLLATEDLVVEHKKVETACFNVHTRVLTLPLWEKASNIVYDLLVGHEVGHALFTPDEDWSLTCKAPQQFINVVEDARVEKLMKRRYAGLAKTFFNGYRELNAEDFFQLENEDISTLNLADRANLYFKVGNFLPLDFTIEEKAIIECISACETFADVLSAAEKLYVYCKEEKQQKQKVVDVDSRDNQQGSSSGEQVEESDTEESEDGESDQEQPNNQGESDSYGGTAQEDKTTASSEQDSEPEVRTDDALREKIKDLVNDDGTENVYIEIPKLNLETVIGKNSEVHQVIDESFKEQKQRSYDFTKETYGKDAAEVSDKALFGEVDVEFKKFKASAQKEVNYLVKEFECRKAADSYARASTARTGVLDTARLHTYKFNEDLFKKVSVIPDGKNHGLIFILDWSGSMQNVITDTCKQLFNLIWFCKKINIPFEVYAFTNEWLRPGYNNSVIPKPHYENKDGLVCVEKDFSLMNLLTSKVNGNELEHQLLNIWRLAACFDNVYYCKYTYPNRLCLSGTPLNESLVALHQILPQFQKQNKLQKVQCVVLTDGEASPLPYHVEIKRDGNSHIGIRGVNPKSTFLRDRKLGTTYKFDYGYQGYTDVLLCNLKDKFPTVNFIGIRVLAGRDANRFIQLYHHYSDKQYNKIQSDWKKEKSFTITNSGYDAYFGLSSFALSQETEFEVANHASKAQIKSAFAKSLKSKKMNKKILGEFIELVV